jgi:hypothetical protein
LWVLLHDRMSLSPVIRKPTFSWIATPI